jgi:hypothetical protein
MELVFRQMERRFTSLKPTRAVSGVGRSSDQAKSESCLAVTESGNICIAALERGAIVEIAPDGRSRFHAVPDLTVTNLCFGEPDRRTAYVTMSYWGRLGAMQWHEPGLKLRYA